MDFNASLIVWLLGFVAIVKLVPKIIHNVEIKEEYVDPRIPGRHKPIEIVYADPYDI